MFRVIMIHVIKYIFSPVKVCDSQNPLVQLPEEREHIGLISFAIQFI